MPISFSRFPTNRRDQARFYLDQGTHLFVVPRSGKSTFAGSHGHRDATNDLRLILETLDRYRDGVLAMATEPSRRLVVDIEQRPIAGQDGTLSLRQHAEAIGVKASLVDYGRTPTAITPRFGLHEHCHLVGNPPASRPILPHVEIKCAGSSARLPDAPGRRWDEACPAHLPLLPVPDWLLELAAGTPEGRVKQHPPLPFEAPLGAREATALGARIAGRMVDKALLRARSMADARNAARGLGWLAVEERISDAYARRAIDRLAEELPSFAESGFSRNGLRRTLHTVYERRCRRG